jgi:tagatose-6-phosphate ketose/aldose isomerase
VWTAIEHALVQDAPARAAFLEPLLARRDLRIVLTGAGTSAFVGECLAPSMKRRTRLRVDAVATTDLVGSPATWLEANVPTLLVSFARSGNSPESMAAVAIAEEGLADCHHLIVTCNAEGSLYQQRRRLRSSHAVLLPDATNDRGFAMTSSFTGMLLAASLAFDLAPEDAPTKLSGWAKGVLETQLPLLDQLVRSSFERVVYLGSDTLKGLAREAALKLLELSDGKVVALAETPLGFRHGPKTIVNQKTLVVVLLSNDPYTRRYDLDLLNELRSDGVAGRILALSARPLDVPHPDDILIPAAAGAVADISLCLPYVVFAQTFAFLQSLSLGLRPDVPNAGGTVSRVVRGVTLHRWDPAGAA